MINICFLLLMIMYTYNQSRNIVSKFIAKVNQVNTSCLLILLFIIILLLKSSLSLLLNLDVVVSDKEKGKEREEWNPGMFWDKVLGNSKNNWRRDHGRSLNGEDGCLPIAVNLRNRSSAGEDGHKNEEDTVLDRGQNEIRSQDLGNLPKRTSFSTEGALKTSYKIMRKRSADEKSVKCHLGDTRRDVGAGFRVLVTGKVTSEDLRSTIKSGRCEGLGADRVCLELVEVAVKNRDMDRRRRSNCIDRSRSVGRVARKQAGRRRSHYRKRHDEY